MNDATLLLVTASNACGLLPLIQLFNDGRWCGTMLVSCAVVSSVLMHASDTTHGLDPGPRLKKYSLLLLNVDRFFAVLTAFYGLWLFYNNPNKTVVQVALPFVGVILGVIGKLKRNLFIYTVTHSLWHFFAYVSLMLVSF